tara:strand:+ start:11164 stop:13344 length:2181 start_codon:yes stop_codon:yes gene_type:complete
MINLEKIAEELFNKIRGRYPKITIGDEASTITNVPEKARFFDFEFSNGNKVNVTLDEKSLTMLYNNDLLSDATESIRQNWYAFMKEMRQFAKKRMLNFDTRDITKSNLDKRDYDYLSKNRPGENQMSESKLYGTSKTSFQDVGNAKIIVKHNEAVDFENPAGRTQRIHSIYVESPEGERYKYPFKHLNGARAMAQHVSEGGNQYDNFGKHIVSLSEELSKLRTFKTYMNRSSVMAEGLAGYMDIVNNRIDTVKETVHKLQRNAYYKEAMENFQETVMEEVPEDVSSNWIDELTIRQFNEDLKGVFPYIYNLVKEGTKSEALTPENLLGEDELPKITDEMNGMVSDWIEKFSKFRGGNGDRLPDGYIQWALNSGITTDFVEENEAEAMRKKYGEEEFENDPMNVKYLDEMPITNAAMEEIEKITGDDDIDTNARIIDKVQSGDADESAGVEEGAVKKALEDDAENLSREEFIEKHGDAEFFDNYNGVEDESMDMHGDFASHLDNVVANSKHEQGPDEASSMGMNKYGLAAKHKDGKFISYKDGKETGTFDSIEELEKHQKGLIQDESTTFEGNAFAQAVQKAKAAGMKKGDKFKTPDGEEHTLEDAILKAGLRLEDFWTADELMAEKEPTDDDTMDVKIGPDGSISKADGDAEEKGEKNELELDEFIKGHFDYTTNNFPKGETAVLTACEKKYGDESLAPAAIIMKKLVTNQDGEMERIKHLAGLAN